MTTTDSERTGPRARRIADRRLDDLAEGTMKMVKVEGIASAWCGRARRARDRPRVPARGVRADPGRPRRRAAHCAWHNWKFRVSDGECVLGEEAVRVHDVDIDDGGAIRVSLNRPDPEVMRPQLLASLRSGIGATTAARSPATWSGCSRRAPTRASWSGRRSPTAPRAPTSVGGTRSPRRPTAWRWSISTRAISGRCRSCRGSPGSPSRARPSGQRAARPGRPARSTRRRSAPRSSRAPRRRPALVLAAIERGDSADAIRPGSPASSATTTCRTATARSTARRRSSCST